MLGLGRALGETMAVTFVIGNAYRISASLFEPGNSIASALANEFNEAADPVHRASLIALGLVLFLLTLHRPRAARGCCSRSSAKAEGREDLKGAAIGTALPPRLLRQPLQPRDVARRRWPSAWPSCCGSWPCCSCTGFGALSADAVHADDAAAGIGGRARQRDLRQRRSSCGSATLDQHADRHPGRHLPRRVRQATAGSRASTRFVNDILLSAPSIVIGLFVYTVYVAQRQALLRLGRLVRAGADRDPGGRAHHREHAAPRAQQPARGRGRARRADVEGDPDGHAARGARRRDHRRAARRRARSRARPRRCCSPRSTTSSGARDMNAPMANLPVVIFQFAMSPYEDWQHARLGGRAADHAGRAAASTSSRARCSARRRSASHACRPTEPMNEHDRWCTAAGAARRATAAPTPRCRSATSTSSTASSRA